MSDGQSQAVRQWVSLPEGSCDVRMGAGVLDTLGSILGGTPGRPEECGVFIDGSFGDEAMELLLRQLADGGYKAHRLSMPENPRTPEGVADLAAQAVEAHITADDLICVAGGADAISAATFMAGRLYGRTPLLVIPTDLDALVEAVVTPRGIDVAGSAEALSTAPCARTVVFDPEIADADPSKEETLLARALMVATAMCDGERSFSELWDRAGSIADGDGEVLLSQLMDTLKSRGHLVASSAIATRQSAGYGHTFVRAMGPLTGAPTSTLLAEGLRFQARISAGMGKFSVDDVLAQDELLETLGLPVIEKADVDPDAMVAALKAERFRTSRRFLLCLPQALGRVRLSAIDDDLIHEHAEAWCASRRQE